MAEDDGALVAFLLLEIARQPHHAVTLAHFLADLVEQGGVFKRTDGKGGGEAVHAELLCLFRGGFQPQTEAALTSRAALRLLFQALDRLKENLGVVLTLRHADRMPKIRAQRDIALFLAQTVGVFLRLGDVGVVIVDRDVEILRQIFQTIA